MAYSLKIVLDTWLKQSTDQGSRLPDEHKQFLESGSILPLAGYEVIADNHIKISLGSDRTGRPLFFKGKQTWYVYRPTVQVLQEGKPIPLPPHAEVNSSQAIYTIKFLLDTWLKQGTTQASQLPDDQKQYMTAGAVLPISGYEMIEQDHLRITFGKDRAGNQVGWRGKNTWLIYRPTVSVLRNGVAIALDPRVDTTPRPTRPAQYNLKITLDTWFKANSKQSNSLPDDQKHPVNGGAVFPLAAFETVENEHLKITLGTDASGRQVFVKGKNTWYVYRPMAQILRDGRVISAIANRMNAEGFALLTQYEGLRLEAYQDIGGVWTIGYGHTDGVFPGQQITQAQADGFLRADLRRFEEAVDDLVNVTLNSNQFSALVSFVYNVGEAAFANSDLRRFLNGGNLSAAANEFPRWNKVFSEVVEGLTRRRNAERALFLGQNWRIF
jgi:GH24 family phage-related lysozyme (muramidase)